MERPRKEKKGKKEVGIGAHKTEKKFQGKKPWNRDTEQFKFVKGNKKEGQGFADERKTQLKHRYNKVLRKERHQLLEHSDRTKQLYAEDADSKAGGNHAQGNPAHGGETQLQSKGKLTHAGDISMKNNEKKSIFHKAELEWKRKQHEQGKKQMEREEQQKQREEAHKKYQQRKKTKFKKLAVKTYKGQPNMASQMEVLLAKITQDSSSQR